MISRSGDRRSEVERRVAPPLAACVTLLLELMDDEIGVIDVVLLPVMDASHCRKSVPLRAISCQLWLLVGMGLNQKELTLCLR